MFSNTLVILVLSCLSTGQSLICRDCNLEKGTVGMDWTWTLGFGI